MGLETATSIEGLDESWPTSLDPVNKGDDHLRLLKQVLKDQFPGVAGDGFAIPIVATEEELNQSTGLIDNIQDQIDALTASIADNNLGITPVGGVINYNGLVANIPANWQLCDGTNGTADMVDKFVYGTNTEGEIGDTGGFADAVNVLHNHTAVAAGDHAHGFLVNTDESGSPLVAAAGDATGNNATLSTNAAGTHNHTINSAGVSGEGRNIPPYVKLAYIQRMS